MKQRWGGVSRFASDAGAIIHFGHTRALSSGEIQSNPRTQFVSAGVNAEQTVTGIVPRRLPPTTEKGVIYIIADHGVNSFSDQSLFVTFIAVAHQPASCRLRALFSGRNVRNDTIAHAHSPSLCSNRARQQNARTPERGRNSIRN